MGDLATVALDDLLDLPTGPVFLLDRTGRLLYANAEAHLAFPTPPVWLESVLDGDPMGRVVPLRVEGETLYLVATEVAEGRPPLPEMPRWLGCVAELLFEGLSDKEIAQQLDKPLSTVRTCVHRVLRRSGVHSRAELLARYRRR